MDFANKEIREQSKAFSKWCGAGDISLLRGRLPVTEKVLQFRAMGTGETSHGAKAVPDAFYGGLVAGMNQTNVIRKYATKVVTEGGGAFQVPTYDDSAVEAVILPENAQAASADIAVSSVMLGAYELHSKIVRVSRELIDDANPAFQRHLGILLGRRLSRLASNLYTTGSGTDEPTGILTAANVAVTSAAPTAITVNDLIDLRYSLDASYDEVGQWMMTPTTLKAIMKLTDDANRPIFDGELLLGRPVLLSASMPTIAAETKPVLFGDLRSYMIREVDDTTVRRYAETYAHLGQIGLAAIHRVDGALADVNGVAVLQMAE